MTRHFLYPQVHAWENLLLAHRKAARGKRGRDPAAGFELDLADGLVRLRDALRDRSYRPGAYHSFWIREPKRWLISAAPFRDRVVHHALCNVIEPFFERRFLSDSYANRRAREPTVRSTAASSSRGASATSCPVTSVSTSRRSITASCCALSSG